MSSPVGVRLATPEDLRFIASTFFRSVLESGAALNQVPFAIVRDGLDNHIEKLLQRSIVRVAFATAEPDEILGYCATGTAVCHHIYTKQAYRRHGIARSLLGGMKTITHPATPGAGKKFALALHLLYNPRLA